MKLCDTDTSEWRKGITGKLRHNKVFIISDQWCVFTLCTTMGYKLCKFCIIYVLLLYEILIFPLPAMFHRKDTSKSQNKNPFKLLSKE